MTDLLSHLVDAPVPNIFILAGLAFLALGIVGKISGTIEPSTNGRIMSGVVGVALVIYGIYAHSVADAARNHAEQTSGKTAKQVQPPQELVRPVSGSRLSGTWKNADPQPRGITKLDVQQSGQLVEVHAWGACSPQDWDWGTAKGLCEHPLLR